LTICIVAFGGGYALRSVPLFVSYPVWAVCTIAVPAYYQRSPFLHYGRTGLVLITPVLGYLSKTANPVLGYSKERNPVLISKVNFVTLKNYTLANQISR